MGTSGDSDYAKLVTYFGGTAMRQAPSELISSVFGFAGPSVSVDTSESSSLVAVHLACQVRSPCVRTVELRG